jgi:hypothetical protein
MIRTIRSFHSKLSHSKKHLVSFFEVVFFGHFSLLRLSLFIVNLHFYFFTFIYFSYTFIFVCGLSLVILNIDLSFFTGRQSFQRNQGFHSYFLHEPLLDKGHFSEEIFDISFTKTRVFLFI